METSASVCFGAVKEDIERIRDLARQMASADDMGHRKTLALLLNAWCDYVVKDASYILDVAKRRH